MIRYIESKMNTPIPVYRFQKQFQKKILLAVTFVLCSEIPRIIIQSPVFKPVMNYCLIINFVYKLFVMLHVVVYIDLMRFLLFSVNLKLNDVTEMRWHRYSVAITFQHIKWIHYNLWKISKMINLQFGWIIVMLMLEYMTYFSACIYWIFLYLENPTNLRQMYFLRKYFLLFYYFTSIDMIFL